MAVSKIPRGRPPAPAAPAKNAAAQPKNVANEATRQAAAAKPADTFSVSPEWERRLRSFAATLDAWINKTEVKNDGALLGAGGKPYPPATPLSKVPAMQPDGGPRNDRTIIYANGAFVTHETAAAEMQAVANSTGSRVVGLYNATESLWGDGLQVLNDEFDLEKNPAVDSLAQVVYRELKAGREVDLFAHSQGGVISSRALGDVRERLISEGMTPKQAEAMLGKVRLETFGAAAFSYPDGPKYTHWINNRDLAPKFLGLDHGKNPLAHAGRGAVVNYFDAPKGGFLEMHSLQNTYLPQREKLLAAEQAARR